MFVCSECGGPQPTEGTCPADGTQLVPIGEDVLLGTTIGPYRVARLLGIGGMGRVYKGVQPTIGSRVAIKVLSRECTDRRDLVDRFFAEAKAVNLIRHESIVNVLDLAVLPDGRPYIIMEYLDGAPLASILEHSQAHGVHLPFGGIARLTAEVLDALAAAHAKGIVHRDLKPDNIFVAPSGRPKVLDFGIARFTDPGANSSTRTGSLLGTPHYMSPEQAAGRPVDHRADLYAIGVILFECVTNRKLFVADSLFDLLRKHVEEPAPSPRAFRPDLDPGLESLILCALAKHPDQRFASAQAMSLALQHATAHLPPDQWTPITASGTHRAMPSWNQQLPASWGSRDQPYLARSLPRPSEQPIAGYVAPSPPPSSSPPPAYGPPNLGNSTTVSASSGQVQKQPPAKQGSRRGLVLALAGVAVVGGIVAVVALRGGSKPDELAAADTPAPPPANPEPVAKPTESSPKQGRAKAADDLQGQLDDLESSVREAAKDMPQVAKAVDDALGKVRAAGVPDVADKTDKAAKTAKTEKTEKTEKVEKDPDDDDETDSDPDVPQAPRTAATTATRKAWVESRALSYPNWNARRVDVPAFIAFAVAEAKRAVPDAQLTRVEVTGVSPSGFADLTLPTLASSHGDIDIRFISKSAAAPDPKIPVGVPQTRLCEFRISGGVDGVEINSMFKTDCKTKVVPVPTCGYAALWKKATGQGAPGNAVAQISYYSASMHDSPRWFFTIGFGSDTIFSKMWVGPGC